ncbi:ribonuclease HII [Sulfuriflexus mobilis]|uniref:ribonuclease HII n=1 Tax=Sulfuriflexus mobilis TaxID=1811807 RepID=UPI000F81A934|nr:ribonuclease HII [Sulfuriflexus mobilis]
MHSKLALYSGQGLIAGVDEVGRGPLAGPVVAAAVILDPTKPINGLADSKAISAKRREALNSEIRHKALCWAIARAEVDEIDELNILHASMLAMKRAVELLAIQPEHAQIDGNRCPSLRCTAEAIVKGDQSVACISAASIIAKVERDREMIELESVYPGYGFASHKGYPTKLHMRALAEHGVTPVHRYSFGPVARLMEKG